MATRDPAARFIEAGVWHGSLDGAQAILADHPEVASNSIHTAAILCDEAGVRRFLERDRQSVSAKADPYGADALVPFPSGYAEVDELLSKSRR